MPRLITLTTDFGLRDGFVGVMRGVMLQICPGAQFVDITHAIPPQDVRTGAFVLANSVPFFPAASVHLAVVDPGVGSARRALAAQVGKTFFVGPDNGLLALALAECEQRTGKRARVVELNRPQYWLPRVSNTFHGRDLFSPCAARLARGTPLGRLGDPVDTWVAPATAAAGWKADGSLQGRVIYIDTYGNLVTNVTESELARLGAPAIEVEVGGKRIAGLVRTYAEVGEGELAALVGSPWRLEIAKRNGNAAEALGVHIDDPVMVRGRAHE